MSSAQDDDDDNPPIEQGDECVEIENEDAYQETGNEFVVSASILDALESHVSRLKDTRRKRKEQLKPKTVIDDEEAQTSGFADMEGKDATVTSIVPIVNLDGTIDPNSIFYKSSTDSYEGDAVLRTLRTLLAMTDERGFQRSPHQVRFHDSFIRATSRVVYKADWMANRPKIMKKNGWEKCSSEILISTPR